MIKRRKAVLTLCHLALVIVYAVAAFAYIGIILCERVGAVDPVQTTASFMNVADEVRGDDRDRD